MVLLDLSTKSEDSMELCAPMKNDRFSSNAPTSKEDLAMKLPDRKRDFVRQTPARTQSQNLPRRTIWKDKGGSARYVLRDEPPPKDIKPTGLGAAARAAVTDALLSSSVAGLVVLENLESAAVATRRRFDRQISQKRLSDASAGSQGDGSEESDPAEGPLARGRRGLLRRAKSLSSVRAGNVSPLRGTNSKTTTVASSAA